MVSSAFVVMVDPAIRQRLPRLVLASASPRRSELLRRMGLEFEVTASDAPEIEQGELTAREIAQVNAYRKARLVAKRHPDALVLAADTVVCLQARLFGKPAHLEAAYQMLEELQGRTHEVVTALCLMHLRQRRYRVSADVTAVTFRSLDSVGIRRYLALTNPLDKAGAYGIQDHGDVLVEGIRGSYTNVVGLPVELLRQELEAWAEPSSPSGPTIC
jgi:septum formation protein